MCGLKSPKYPNMDYLFGSVLGTVIIVLGVYTSCLGTSTLVRDRIMPVGETISRLISPVIGTY